VTIGAPPISNEPGRIPGEPVGSPAVVMDVTSVRFLSGAVPDQMIRCQAELVSF